MNLDPLPRLIHHLRIATLVGLDHELGNGFCMLKRAVRGKKQIVTEPVP